MTRKLVSVDDATVADDDIPQRKSGTWVNRTIAQLRADLSSISAAFGVGSLEVGHASDTTISRTGAGAIAVEGVGVALNSTSLTHTASTIELGHASDTTLARSAAGRVTVEGKQVFLLDASTVANDTTLDIVPVVQSTYVEDTGLTGAVTVTATDGQPGWQLWVALTGTAARAITWASGDFEAGAVPLPTTTTTTQRLDVAFTWNAATSRWRAMASGSA